MVSLDVTFTGIAPEFGEPFPCEKFPSSAPHYTSFPRSFSQTRRHGAPIDLRAVSFLHPAGESPPMWGDRRGSFVQVAGL